ncbi:PREDICTED: SH2 domain-containing protein 7, partial [Gekko japonicus]|uniref:SH2 domain-containing protein 7 n=1 Tax=Gekko japonicus TaxID=146911 RepID=A0ABM1JZM7_GEKJA
RIFPFELEDGMEGEQPPFFSGRQSDLGTEKPPSEMVKDLVLRWFSDVQAPLLSQDGTLPGWFHGFITRKQTEELLKDQDFGCFLIRLRERAFGYILSYSHIVVRLVYIEGRGNQTCSTQTEELLKDQDLGCFLIRLRERAFGYILSYRGKDRCRHFVISCQKNGRYVVAGDTRNHESLAELIRYYQISEIEPFGENLTVACSKPEEKNIYDQISLESRTPPKPSPELVRQGSSSDPTASPAGKDITSQQSAKPRRKLQEQQKSLSKERQGWSLESHPEDDPDEAPPIPDRSSLLMAECSKKASGNQASVYTSPKHLKDEGLAGPADMDQSFTDRPPNRDDPSQGSLHRKNTSLQLYDQFYGKRTEEAGRLGTIYSEIGADQHKSTSTPPESPSGQPFSLTMQKKSSLNSPASTPPKLSPKLPDKPKTFAEAQGLQETSLASYSSSPMIDERRRMSSPSETSSDPPRTNLYGQVHKLKSQKPAVSVGDDPYERIPFEWPKRRIHERDPESLPKSSALKAKEVYEQACMESSRSPRAQSCTENTYEKIPAHLSKSSSTRHFGARDDIYEKISFAPGKGAWAKAIPKILS